MSNDVEVPQFAYPFRLDATGDLAVLEQDDLPDVRQCVYVALRTPVGSRPLAPQAGVEDLTFVDELDAEQLAATLEDQEPRAQITVTAQPVSAIGELAVSVDVALTGEPSTDPTETI